MARLIGSSAQSRVGGNTSTHLSRCGNRMRWYEHRVRFIPETPLTTMSIKGINKKWRGKLGASLLRFPRGTRDVKNCTGSVNFFRASGHTPPSFLKRICQTEKGNFLKKTFKFSQKSYQNMFFSIDIDIWYD